MKYGVDVDNVLAAFSEGFIDLIKARTGKQLPPVSDVFPDVWAFHKPYITPLEETDLWGVIGSSNFWLDLKPMAYAEMTLQLLSAKRYNGDEIYFITSRSGAKAKLLTEWWLRNWGYDGATVLIVDSDHAKGELARALKLDVFVDDKPGNCERVVQATKQQVAYDGLMSMEPFYEYPCRVCLVDAPYNRDADMVGVERVPSAWAALTPSQELSPNVAIAA